MIFNCKPRCLCIKTMKMVLPEMGAGFMPTSLNKICIHARNAHGTGLGDRPLECHHGVWSHQSNFHFRKALFSLIQFLLALQFYHQSCFHCYYVLIMNPASTVTMFSSSIPLPRSLCFYHQSRFHCHYVFIIYPASNVMRQHVIGRIPCMNPSSISVKETWNLKWCLTLCCNKCILMF